MDNLFQRIHQYETGLYLLLAFPLVLLLLRAWKAWTEVQGALFGLEWEQARRRFYHSLLGATFVLGLMVAVFFAATLGRREYVGMVIPTITATLPLTPDATTGTPQPTASPTPLPPAEPDLEACIPGQVEIVEPANGATVQGEIQIRGSASIPNFAFYKVEFAPKGTALFLTIKAGRQPKVDDVLVDVWDTGLLTPGDYLLQLVVVDTAGKAQPPCRILIHVQAP